MTHVANIEAGETDFFHSTLHGLGKCDFDLKFQVGAGFAFMAGLRTTALAAKDLAEKVAEAGAATGSSATKIETAEVEMNVFRHPAPVSARARRGSTTLARRVETELVIHLAFFGVG